MAVRSTVNRKDAPRFHIQPLQNLYHGFYITARVHENPASSPQETFRQVYVAPLIVGSPTDLAVGSRAVYVEQDGNGIRTFQGLQHFIYYPNRGKNVFIFDNHQHAFFFWIAAYLAGIISPGCQLVHIDRHSDMWQPAKPPDFSLNKSLSLPTVFEYTIQVLTNATFIKPALQLGLFADVEILNGVYPPVLEKPQGYVLDIDMDIFEGDPPGSAAYRFKMQRFRKYMSRASLITIATSPGFIEQPRAVMAVKELLHSPPVFRRRPLRKSA